MRTPTPAEILAEAKAEYNETVARLQNPQNWDAMGVLDREDARDFYEAATRRFLAAMQAHRRSA